MTKKKPDQEVVILANRMMMRIDGRLAKMGATLIDDQRSVIRNQIKQVLGELIKKGPAANPKNPTVQEKAKQKGEQVFAEIVAGLKDNHQPNLWIGVDTIVREEVTRAVALRILGVGNMPEDLERLKKFEHEFDLETLSKVLESSGGKRQLAAGAIGQLITAKITTHKDLKNFLRRVLKCTDAQGIFSLEAFEKLEPYPPGAMGVDTLNLLLRYLVARKLLKEQDLKKITGLKQQSEKKEDEVEDNDFL